MIAEFNKDYPNITVEAEAVTDYAEDALLRLTTGDWGDIMLIPAVDKASCRIISFLTAHWKYAEGNQFRRCMAV